MNSYLVSTDKCWTGNRFSKFVFSLIWKFSQVVPWESIMSILIYSSKSLLKRTRFAFECFRHIFEASALVYCSSLCGATVDRECISSGYWINTKIVVSLLPFLSKCHSYGLYTLKHCQFPLWWKRQLLKSIVPLVLIHNDEEEEFMNIGAEKLQGQEMLFMIDLYMHEWRVHSKCVALPNKQHFGILTT